MNSYLRILLSNGKYLIDTHLVNKVLDIENGNIKGVPVQNIGDFNSFIGVSTIDGDIVPILDLKKELGLESIPEKFDKKLYPSSQFDDGRKDTTIILEIEGSKRGYIVDDIIDLIELDDIVTDKKFLNIVIDDEILTYINIESI